jgi:hypothetical protein
LEYLVIVTLLIVALLAVRGIVSARANALYTTSGDKIGEATTAIQGFALQPR